MNGEIKVLDCKEINQVEGRFGIKTRRVPILGGHF